MQCVHGDIVFIVVTDALQSAGALFGVLLSQKAIVAVAKSRAQVLHPHDLLLLANLVRSNESFKQAQTFTPVCLPHFNAAAFLHAYVQYLDVVSTLSSLEHGCLSKHSGVRSQANFIHCSLNLVVSTHTWLGMMLNFAWHTSAHVTLALS